MILTGPPAARQVFVRALGAEGVQIQVSQDGGEEPRWSRHSRELFYRRLSSERSELIAAQMETVPGLRVVSRRVLFSMADTAVSTPHANYDVS